MGAARTGRAGAAAMTATTRVGWDEWRAAYDHWTVTDQRRFYDLVFAEYRDQDRFDHEALGRLIDRAGRPVTVVELGGWDGGFAAAMLRGDRRIEWWTNYEISQCAVDEAVCNDPRYLPVCSDNWYWDGRHVADVFVASHVLEHLRLRDVLASFDATDCQWMFLQVPVSEAGRDWTGYSGTHILECGWAKLHEELGARGFGLLDELSRPMVRCYEKADG